MAGKWCLPTIAELLDPSRRDHAQGGSDSSILKSYVREPDPATIQYLLSIFTKPVVPRPDVQRPVAGPPIPGIPYTVLHPLKPPEPNASGKHGHADAGPQVHAAGSQDTKHAALPAHGNDMDMFSDSDDGSDVIAALESGDPHHAPAALAELATGSRASSAAGTTRTARAAAAAATTVAVTAAAGAHVQAPMVSVAQHQAPVSATPPQVPGLLLFAPAPSSTRPPAVVSAAPRSHPAPAATLTTTLTTTTTTTTTGRHPYVVPAVHIEHTLPVTLGPGPAPTRTSHTGAPAAQAAHTGQAHTSDLPGQGASEQTPAAVQAPAAAHMPAAAAAAAAQAVPAVMSDQQRVKTALTFLRKQVNKVRKKKEQGPRPAGAGSHAAANQQPATQNAAGVHTVSLPCTSNGPAAIAVTSAEGAAAGTVAVPGVAAGLVAAGAISSSGQQTELGGMVPTSAASQPPVLPSRVTRRPSVPHPPAAAPHAAPQPTPQQDQGQQPTPATPDANQAADPQVRAATQREHPASSASTGRHRQQHQQQQQVPQPIPPQQQQQQQQLSPSPTAPAQQPQAQQDVDGEAFVLQPLISIVDVSRHQSRRLHASMLPPISQLVNVPSSTQAPATKQPTSPEQQDQQQQHQHQLHQQPSRHHHHHQQQQQQQQPPRHQPQQQEHVVEDAPPAPSDDMLHVAGSGEVDLMQLEQEQGGQQTLEHHGVLTRQQRQQQLQQQQQQQRQQQQQQHQARQQHNIRPQPLHQERPGQKQQQKRKGGGRREPGGIWVPDHEWYDNVDQTAAKAAAGVWAQQIMADLDDDLPGPATATAPAPATGAPAAEGRGGSIADGGAPKRDSMRNASIAGQGVAGANQSLGAGAGAGDGVQCAAEQATGSTAAGASAGELIGTMNTSAGSQAARGSAALPSLLSLGLAPVLQSLGLSNLGLPGLGLPGDDLDPELGLMRSDPGNDGDDVEGAGDLAADMSEDLADAAALSQDSDGDDGDGMRDSDGGGASESDDDVAEVMAGHPGSRAAGAFARGPQSGAGSGSGGGGGAQKPRAKSGLRGGKKARKQRMKAVGQMQDDSYGAEAAEPRSKAGGGEMVELGFYAEIKQWEKEQRKMKRQRGWGDGKSEQVQKYQVTERLACRFWRLGRCTKGTDCQFRHEGEPVTKLIPCRYHVQQACTKGEACSYSHEPGLIEPCKLLITTGACTRATCRYSHAAMDNQQVAALKEYWEEQERRQQQQQQQ